MPGIRMGWIVINDRNGAFEEIRRGLQNVIGRNFWPNSTTQIALPDILVKTPKSFLEENPRKVFVRKFQVIITPFHSDYFQVNASSAFKILVSAPGLNPIMPKGAMYMMIGINLDKFPEFENCLEFAHALIREQSVQTLPGYPCFYFKNFFRIVLTVPHELIEEACIRIREFCETHFTLSKH